MSKLGRSILLVFLALAIGASKSSAQTAAIQVHVYDYAGLDQAELRHFLSLFEEIWVRASLTVQVSVCRGALALPCESRSGVEPLVVRLLPGFAKTMNNARRPPLGQSFVSAGGGGYSSVFLDSVRNIAAAANASWVMVLAYTSAHEVGHLLLGAQAHTPRGLMKAVWDRGDYQAIAQNQYHFTQEQVRQLAQRSETTLSAQTQKDR